MFSVEKMGLNDGDQEGQRRIKKEELEHSTLKHLKEDYQRLTKKERDHILRSAVETGFKDMVIFLLDKGANINEKGDDGLTLLHLAAINGYKDVVTTLLENRANVNEKEARGFTPLHHAAGRGYKDIVIALLENGAKVDEKNADWYTPLHLAAINGYKDVVTTLLENGANINEKGDDGLTLLHLAAISGLKDVVTTLLENRANVNEKEAHGFTPLHHAAGMGYKDIVIALLENVAKVDEKNADGCTPLHRAALNGRLDIVKYLVEEKEVDVNQADNNGLTALHYAAYNDKLDTVKYLVEEKKVDVNQADNNGLTALHYAAGNGQLDIVKYLVGEKNVDVNQANSNGKTALHLAVERGHTGVTKALIQKILIQDFSVQKPDSLKDALSIYWDECLGEVKKLEEENELLYNFLKESNINELIGMWERNPERQDQIDNHDNLKEQYPEYADILINKANQVKKEISLHNHKPLIDFLSTHYERDFQAMTFTGIKNFFEVHRDDFRRELGGGGITLITFVDYTDITARHIPTLKVQTLGYSVKNNLLQTSIIISDGEGPDSIGASIHEPIDRVPLVNGDGNQQVETEKNSNNNGTEINNSSTPKISVLKQEGNTQGKQSSDPAVPQNTKRSKLPFIAVSLAVDGVATGIAIAVYLEMLALGIAVGAICCLVAAAIYCSSPSNSLEKSSVEAVAATIETP
ncbi:MAG: ankyrin repeat domain-containing protein [Wolbachia sp.]